MLARLQQHLERGRRAGVGLDGSRIDRGVRLRGRPGKPQRMSKMPLWEDPRIARGMRVQLDLRRQRLAGGDKSLGWKVGFGAPAMLKQLGISGPLVGFLTQNARVPSGGSVSLAGWAKPVAEPEIAVHIGRDVPAGADHDTTAAAIAGISPAIELVDVHTPPQEPERVLTEN